jgi:hypothetical protein
MIQARLAVIVSGVIEVEEVVGREDRHVAAEMLRELRLRAEGEGAHAGVRPIGPDHQIEPARRPAREVGADPRIVLLEGGDAVAEAIFGLAPRRLIEDPRQIAAQDLHLAAQEFGGHARPAAVRCIDVPDRAHMGLRPLNLIQQSHPRQVPHRLAPEIDGVAPLTHPGGALHHGWIEAVTPQPEGQCRPGDPGTGD